MRAQKCAGTVPEKTRGALAGAEGAPAAGAEGTIVSVAIGFSFWILGRSGRSGSSEVVLDHCDSGKTSLPVNGWGKVISTFGGLPLPCFGQRGHTVSITSAIVQASYVSVISLRSHFGQRMSITYSLDLLDLRSKVHDFGVGGNLRL